MIVCVQGTRKQIGVLRSASLAVLMGRPQINEAPVVKNLGLLPVGSLKFEKYVGSKQALKQLYEFRVKLTNSLVLS